MSRHRETAWIILAPQVRCHRVRQKATRPTPRAATLTTVRCSGNYLIITVLLPRASASVSLKCQSDPQCQAVRPQVSIKCQSASSVNHAQSVKLSGPKCQSLRLRACHMRDDGLSVLYK
eukprot:scaffold264626_cov20-Tisochrysis_lutea.AAC.1